MYLARLALVLSIAASVHCTPADAVFKQYRHNMFNKLGQKKLEDNTDTDSYRHPHIGNVFLNLVTELKVKVPAGFRNKGLNVEAKAQDPERQKNRENTCGYKVSVSDSIFTQHII